MAVAGAMKAVTGAMVAVAGVKTAADGAEVAATSEMVSTAVEEDTAGTVVVFTAADIVELQVRARMVGVPG